MEIKSNQIKKNEKLQFLSMFRLNQISSANKTKMCPTKKKWNVKNKTENKNQIKKKSILKYKKKTSNMSIKAAFLSENKSKLIDNMKKIMLFRIVLNRQQKKKKRKINNN